MGPECIGAALASVVLSVEWFWTEFSSTGMVSGFSTRSGEVCAARLDAPSWVAGALVGTSGVSGSLDILPCTELSFPTKKLRRLVSRREVRDTFWDKYLRTMWSLDETTASPGEVLRALEQDAPRERHTAATCPFSSVSTDVAHEEAA